MFFRKRREAARAAAAQARQDIVDNINAEVEAAQALEDPVARLEKLDDLRTGVDALAEGVRAGLRGKATNKVFLPYFTVTGTALAGAVAAFTALAFPPGAMILVAVPAAIGGLWAGEKRKASFLQRAEEEHRPFFEALEGIKARVTGITDELVASGISTFVASEKFDALQARPGLRDSFVAALRKRVTEAPEQRQFPHGKKPDGTAFRL